MAVGRKDNNKKLAKVVSTKLSIEDYAVFRKLTNVIHQHGAIPEATLQKVYDTFCFHLLTNYPACQDLRHCVVITNSFRIEIQNKSELP
jgi:hypothetical protein